MQADIDVTCCALQLPPPRRQPAQRAPTLTCRKKPQPAPWPTPGTEVRTWPVRLVLRYRSDALAIGGFLVIILTARDRPRSPRLPGCAIRDERRVSPFPTITA